MKRIILLIICFLVCGCTKNEAVTPVKDYFNDYKNHNINVTKSLDELISHENLTSDMQSMYKTVMKKLYYDLEYEITEETFNGDKATITVNVTTYDYNNSKKKALQYKNDHNNEFLNDDKTFNDTKYKYLQLEYMKSEDKRVSYTILFNVNFDGEKWVLENPDYTVIQKIHGIYEE